MAVADFTGSDVLVVITALAAGIATIVGAVATKRKPEEDDPNELADFRTYVERTFVPRSEFATSVQHGHDLRHALRNEIHMSINDQEDRVRAEIRAINQRVDNIRDSLPPRRRT